VAKYPTEWLCLAGIYSGWLLAFKHLSLAFYLPCSLADDRLISFLCKPSSAQLVGLTIFNNAINAKCCINIVHGFRSLTNIGTELPNRMVSHDINMLSLNHMANNFGVTLLILIIK